MISTRYARTDNKFSGIGEKLYAFSSYNVQNMLIGSYIQYRELKTTIEKFH